MLYGLTGGMGSGKSKAASILREMGYKVLDADQIGREVTRKGQPLLRLLVKEFGIDIIREDGELDRRLLADICFIDREKTRRLNELVQTAILCRANEKAHKHRMKNGKQVMFFEVPLLFEAGWDKYMKEIWLVTAPEDLRIKRIKERDNLSDADIRARMRLQMSEEEKMQKSDVIIENDEGIEKLRTELQRAVSERLN